MTTSKPPRVQIQENNIPEELKALDQWGCWYWLWKEGKWTKPPINPKTGRPAKSNDPTTWGTYADALKYYKHNQNMAGLGFVFRKDDPFTGIDLDHCRNPETGEVESWAMDIIQRFNSYCEISPSMTGDKLWMKGKGPGRINRKKGNIEMCNQEKYFTVTGNVFKELRTIEDRDELVKQFYWETFEEEHSQEGGKRQASGPGQENNNGYSWDGNIDNLPISQDKKRLIYGGEPIGQRSESLLSVIDALIFANLSDDQIRQVMKSYPIGQKYQEKGASKERWLNAQINKARNFVKDRAKPGNNGKGNFKAKARPSEQPLPPVIEEIGETTEQPVAVPFLDEEVEKTRLLKLTDQANGERFAKTHGDDVRYCYRFSQWFIWDRSRWLPDETGAIMRKAKSVVRDMYSEAKLFDDKDDRKDFIKAVTFCESEKKLRSMVSMAQSELRISVSPEKFDQDPWLLNCLTGTINLRTGQLQPHNREDMLTKLAPWKYDPKAQCPNWLDHLNKVMNCDQGMISFLRRALGYSCTGITDERVIFIEHGFGANGKSITNDVITLALGDYAARTPTETLLVKKYDGGIPNDIARLNGTRFVNASEVEAGRRLAESQIKDLSGGDKISARFLRQEFFEFYPLFKIWLSTNHKPVIKGTENAIWDRIRLIPFTVRFEGKDKKPKNELIETFKGEMPGILNWLVHGCLEWQRQGLNPPEKVTAATEEYRTEMDIVGNFIDECCHLGNTLKCTVKDLYERYEKWCDDNGDKIVMSNKMFTMTLTEREGIGRSRRGGIRYYTGLKIDCNEGDR